MSKAKQVKRVVAEDSEQSSESELEELSKKKPAKQQLLQQKKKAVTKQSPQIQAESQDDDSVSKDKGKKVIKTSVEPIRKKSLEKNKKKQPVQVSPEHGSEEEPKQPIKKGVIPKHTGKTKKHIPPSQQSESDEIIEQPKKKGVSPKVKPTKSPISAPKPSPKVQSKPSPKVQQKPAKKADFDSQQDSQEAEAPEIKQKTEIKKATGKNATITHQPLNSKQAHTKKVQADESEQQQESPEVVKSKKKAGKQIGKKVEDQNEDEKEPQTKTRKASKDSLKVAGKKIAEDEQGEFQVCVQQLSFNAYDADIKSHFQECGNILNVKLLTKPDGKSKGTAFVKFGLKSELNKALELDGSQLMGRPVKVSEAQKNSNGSDNNQRGNSSFQNRGPRNNSDSQQKYQSNAQIQNSTLFIGGLSFKSSQQSMKRFFQQCGQVRDTRIVNDRDTGRSKGFGYVEFADVESAKKAYKQLNGSQLDGRQIRLDASKPRDRPEGGDSRGGYGGGSRGGYGGGNRGGGYGGGNRGGGGGGYGNRNPGNSQVDLSQEDRNLKSGAMGTYAGKKVML